MRSAVLVAGLGWGDEGKGRVVDALARRLGSTLVVRYNGGCQAAHTVVGKEGRRHVFSQWGSGTLAGARTFLSRRVVVDLPAMRRESDHLHDIMGVPDPWGLLTVDPDCPVTTPWHKALCRQREVRRGSARHGSCGQGVGEVNGAIEAGESVIRVRDLLSGDDGERKVAAVLTGLARQVEDLLPKGVPAEKLTGMPSEWVARARQVAEWLRLSPLPPEDMDASPVIFEGAQGALLDQWRGFHPHTTWSDCTFGGARELLKEWGHTGAVLRVGVLRGFATRHGHGPFPTEFGAGRMRDCYLGHETNVRSEWQGEFRVGHFDAVLSRYAIHAVGGVDGLALTCLDRVGRRSLYCDGYDLRQLDDDARGLFVRSHADTAWSVADATPGLLAQQQRVGEALARVRPNLCQYEEVPVEAIGTLLDTPVVMACRGPAHEDTDHIWARGGVIENIAV